MIDSSKYPLTSYSHGAGCGCKIAPKVLDEILQTTTNYPPDTRLLVGNDERDDAAVYDLGDGTAIISTTDFFMPIVDDPFEFGRIAAVNAISDVYAMGGQPLLAIAILGWPIKDLPTAVANKVIAGGRAACQDAGILLAGGHSIDSPEPIFGLAVTGRVAIEHLKKNGGAKEGDYLYLTKPLGVGVLSTAQKKGKLLPPHQRLAVESMTKLNAIGERLAQLEAVHAMTDVTGFGLLGHLGEMCKASACGAVVNFDQVPLLDQEAIHQYIEQKCIPGGTHRNWASYGDDVSEISAREKVILCDPQTSGGLLLAVDPAGRTEFESLTASHGLSLTPIGEFVSHDPVSSIWITVR